MGGIGAFWTLANHTIIGKVVCIAAHQQEVAKAIKPDDLHTSAIVGHSCGVTTVRGCSLPLALYTLLGNSESLSALILMSTSS
eukprot:m51a1_g12274 hypothetical protein (83) ;mRNA; f:222705-223024